MKFEHKKSLGQNFLNNKNIPRIMADAGYVTNEDLVLEIGPGTGALTRELLDRGARVLAIETDHRAIEALNEKFEKEIEDGDLKIIDADIKKFDLDSLNLEPNSFKVIANIPYYLSGFLFRLFLNAESQPSEIVFLVQKEVAERIARSEKESLLSLSVKVFGEPMYIKTVKRGNFTPQPKVDSAIISVKDINRSRLGDIDSDFFFSILKAGFAYKRKQLIGNLSKIYNKEDLIHIFSTLNLPHDVRAEDVSLNLWLKICENLSNSS